MTEHTGERVLPARSYLICGSQRTGSWLLCKALAATGLAGNPQEYFLPDLWEVTAAQWRVDPRSRTQLAETFRRGTSANGVFGSKMMWNYFEDAVAWWRDVVPAEPSHSSADLLRGAMPDVRFVWLRREDDVRQAVSWWRAGASNEYLARIDGSSTPAPEYDKVTLDGFVALVRRCNEGWAAWFDQYGIDPLDVTYEQLVADLGGEVRRVLAFLDIEPSAAHPSTDALMADSLMTRQADEVTEAIVARYRADE